MIITIADAVFAAPARVHPFKLLSLLDLCLEGRHRILVDPIYEPDAERQVNLWLESLSPPWMREIAETVLSQGNQQEARASLVPLELRIEDIATPDWQSTPPLVPLADALTLAQQPLKVCVENWRSDGEFLRRMIPDKYRALFEKARENNWLFVDNGGGLPVLKSRVEAVRDFKEKLRMWVMFDSDAPVPGNPSKPAKDLERFCRRNNVPHHALKRRAIENYLPMEALNHYTIHGAGSKKREVYEAYVHMEPQQRHHYNLKEGFNSGNSTDRLQQKEYFGTHYEKPELHKGFGDKIWSETCACIPDYFEDIWLRNEQSRDDDALNEASEMIRDLLQRL